MRACLLVLVGVVACGKSAPPGTTGDMARASLMHPDLAQSPTMPGADMTSGPSAQLVITGDGASGFTGATLTRFTCTLDSNGDGVISVSPFPNNFPSTSVLGGEALALDIFKDGISIVGNDAVGTIYYQSAGKTFTTQSKTGTVDDVALAGTSGAMGTLTANGGWSCP